MIHKIVFFIQNFGRPAGSERATSIVASGLAEKGYDITILSICGNNTSCYPIHERVKLCTLINAKDVDNRKLFFKVLKSLNQFYTLHQFDVCVDVMPSLSIYTILLKQKFKFKNITWEHFNFKINTGMCWYGRRFAMLFSDYIVTLTKTDKKYYSNNNYIRSSVDYIYNPSPFQKTSIHNTNNKNILSVGRLNSQKGFDRLVKVWAKVEPKTDWNLFVYGDGEEKDALINLIHIYGLKRMYLCKTVKNIESKYFNSNIYISTARYEGLPMTMIEAQSFGLPIISLVYDTGPKDIVTDRQDGILVNSEDEEKLIERTASSLLYLIEHERLREKMSEAAFQNSQRFKIDPIINKWLLILENLR